MLSLFAYWVNKCEKQIIEQRNADKTLIQTVWKHFLYISILKSRTDNPSSVGDIYITLEIWITSSKMWPE